MCKFLLQSVASWDLCLFDALGDLWYGSIGPINFTPDDDKPLWNIYVDLEHNNNNNQISAESRNIALTNSVTTITIILDFDTLKSDENGCHFEDDFYQIDFIDEIFIFGITSFVNFVAGYSIDNMWVMVIVMA